MENLNLKVTTPENGVVTILEGKALPLSYPESVKFTGTINSVVEYYKHRKEVCNSKNSRVEYSYQKKQIKLFIDEKNSNSRDEITGKIEFTEPFTNFAINTDKTWTIDEFLKFVKKNIRFFDDREVHRTLVAELSNYKAKTTTDVTRVKDDRANLNATFDRKVISNLPEKFKLTMQILKGYPAFTFNVEICLDSTSTGTDLWLQANDLFETLENAINEIIDTALVEIDVPKLEY